MNNQFIILAAGKGTRMNSALPKVLVNLRGKPLIQHLLDNIRAVQNVLPPVMVVGHKSELVQSFLGTKDYIYAFQEEQHGTGHALATGLKKADADNVIVLYGDKPFIKSKTLRNFIDSHNASGSVFSMLTMAVPNYENDFFTFYGDGRIIRDSAGKFLAIRELADASEEERQIKETNPGFYIFNRAWLEENIGRIERNKKGEYYLTDLVEIAVKQNTPINTMEADPFEVYGINTPAQLKLAEKFC